jgi:hypothetical protein
MRPVLVSFRFASGAPSTVPSECDLRPKDNQGQPDDRCDREWLTEQDHSVKQRKDGRQIVP